MIARLKGILDELTGEHALVDVNGVGYDVHVPKLVTEHLPKVGSPITLEIYTHVRETSFDLYGFRTKMERDIFAFLLEASGVGPKLGLAVFSTIAAERFLQAIRNGEVHVLTAVPGIGKKKAEKLLLELRDKCDKRFSAWAIDAERKRFHKDLNTKAGTNSATPSQDLFMALSGLGYRDMEIEQSLMRFQRELTDISFEAALRICLQDLSQKKVQVMRGSA